MSDIAASPGSDDRADHSEPDPSERPDHAERLSVPWWWWPPVLGVGVLLAAELHMGFPGVRSWLPYLITIPLSVAVLVWLGRVRVGVGAPPVPAEAGRAEPDTEPEVRAERAHMPVRHVGRVDVVTGEAKRRALGPDLDPTAYVLHRPWIGPAVRLEVLDPDDPTPYWVISTRHPEDLVAALRGESPDSPAAGPGLTPRSRDR